MIVTYGQSDSGKTYTIEGGNDVDSSLLVHSSGLLPRTVETLFSKFELEERVHSKKFRLQIGAVFLCENKMCDLLKNPENESIFFIFFSF